MKLASQPRPPMMIRNSRIVMTVLRLFLAIARYIACPSELHARRLGDRREVGDLEEVARRESQTLGEDVVREDLDLGVQLAHATVVEPARGLDLVFRVDEVGLQSQEVLARLQLRVRLRHGED